MTDGGRFVAGAGASGLAVIDTLSIHAEHLHHYISPGIYFCQVDPHRAWACTRELRKHLHGCTADLALTCCHHRTTAAATATESAIVVIVVIVVMAAIAIAPAPVLEHGRQDLRRCGPLHPHRLGGSESHEHAGDTLMTTTV
jgi:hypothetical protein